MQRAFIYIPLIICTIFLTLFLLLFALICIGGESHYIGTVSPFTITWIGILLSLPSVWSLGIYKGIEFCLQLQYKKALLVILLPLTLTALFVGLIWCSSPGK